MQTNKLTNKNKAKKQKQCKEKRKNINRTSYTNTFKNKDTNKLLKLNSFILTLILWNVNTL